MRMTCTEQPREWPSGPALFRLAEDEAGDEDTTVVILASVGFDTAVGAEQFPALCAEFVHFGTDEGVVGGDVLEVDTSGGEEVQHLGFFEGVDLEVATVDVALVAFLAIGALGCVGLGAHLLGGLDHAGATQTHRDDGLNDGHNFVLVTLGKCSGRGDGQHDQCNQKSFHVSVNDVSFFPTRMAFRFRPV